MIPIVPMFWTKLIVTVYIANMVIGNNFTFGQEEELKIRNQNTERVSN